LQFVEGNRQIPHTLSGRVIDRVGDGRRNADDADLADAFDAQRIDDVEGAERRAKCPRGDMLPINPDQRGCFLIVPNGSKKIPGLFVDDRRQA